MIDKREMLEAYLYGLKENYKRDYIKLWKNCCKLCKEFEFDTPSTEIMIDTVLDYNTDLGDEDIAEILKKA